MAVEWILVIALPLTLFGGLFLAIYFSFSEGDRDLFAEGGSRAIASAEDLSFYGGGSRDEIDVGLAVKQIEHHVRLELLVAGRFVERPSVTSLWHGRGGEQAAA